MKHAECLRDLLRPLGVYNLEAVFNGGELNVQGEQLDQLMVWLEEIQMETSLVTAEDWGIENVAKLFARRPVADNPRKMASALAALLRIGGDSFTLEAINDTINGCGVSAVVKEVRKGEVSVSFPGVAGEPANFPELKKIIEDILPAHLGIEYDLRYITWIELEESFHSWQEIEDLELSWIELQTFVEYL